MTAKSLSALLCSKGLDVVKSISDGRITALGPTTAREYSFHAFIARGDSFAAGDIAGTSSEDAHARAAELWGCDAALIDSHPSTECRHRGCAGRTRDGR